MSIFTTEVAEVSDTAGIVKSVPPTKPEAFENVDGRWLRLGAYTESDARILPFDAVPLDIPSLLEGVAPNE